MKLKTLLSLLFLVISKLHAQDPAGILQKAFIRCQNISSGYYQITTIKFSDAQKDTIKLTSTCSFKKTKEDTIFHALFLNHTIDQDSQEFYAMFSGILFTYGSLKDSSGTVMSNKKWPHLISEEKKKIDFYLPFMDLQSAPLQHDLDFVDEQQTFKLAGSEKIKEIDCFRISVKKIATSASPISSISHFTWWISKDQFLPMKYDIATATITDSDTLRAYESHLIDTIDLVTPVNGSAYSISAFPKAIRMSEYSDIRLKPLANGSRAPNWTLPDLKGEPQKLSELKGQLVLLVFFHTKTIPAVFALPALQVLQEYYEEKGLHVIAIDPLDTDVNLLSGFFKKRGLNYQVLLGTSKVVEDYGVMRYPHYFLIDRQGKVVWQQMGFSGITEDELYDVVRRNLEK